jgi:hypothetical protein
MTNDRASMFEGLDDFVPQASPAASPRSDEVRAVAERNEFHSRSPVEQAPPPPRRRRTGRNIQLNLKVDRETRDSLYRLADAHGWVLGEAVKNALQALEERLDKPVS